ncbi:hypothetical protein NDU88_001212 [Pleurodeles waltl]|uniref:MsrB domain-containing protein n=1 Tax=Pleurodeles waltl TaxID=8319 RepID=A0AAV7LWZ0_PLEWA|nr:hypothetical protein NDU88_001212 [Pleurodeles waltl]
MSFCFFNGGEKFKDHFRPGIYACAKCGYELFSSRSKFEHSSPWPAFTETIHEDSVSRYKEPREAYKSCIRETTEIYKQYEPAKRNDQKVTCRSLVELKERPAKKRRQCLVENVETVLVTSSSMMVLREASRASEYSAARSSLSLKTKLMANC